MVVPKRFLRLTWFSSAVSYEAAGKMQRLPERRKTTKVVQHKSSRSPLPRRVAGKFYVERVCDDVFFHLCVLIHLWTVHSRSQANLPYRGTLFPCDDSTPTRSRHPCFDTATRCAVRRCGYMPSHSPGSTAGRHCKMKEPFGPEDSSL